jgi:two-component system NtrC family response regulator
LQERGFNVFTASNEKEALDQVKKQNIDVALLDIRMPDIDGITLLKRLKKIDPTLEVVMLTAYASLENAIEAMKQGPMTSSPNLASSLTSKSYCKRLLKRSPWPGRTSI